MVRISPQGDELADQVRLWMDKDKSGYTRAKVEQILKLNDSRRHFLSCFWIRVPFEKSMLEAQVGPGKGRMNTYLIKESVTGLARYLRDQGTRDKGVVITYDARPLSLEFAHVAAGVLAAWRIKAYVFKMPVFLPVCSFTVKRIDAAAGLAFSSGPLAPDTYRCTMYDAGGVPLSDLASAQVEAQIELVSEAPRFMRFYELDKVKERSLFHELGEVEEKAYLDAVVGLLPEDGAVTASKVPSGENVVAYTPLNGLGAEIVERLLKERGHTSFTVETERDSASASTNQHDDLTDSLRPYFEDPLWGEERMAPVCTLAVAKGASLICSNDADMGRLRIDSRRAAALETIDFTSTVSSPNHTNHVGLLLADHLMRRALADPANAGKELWILTTPLCSRAPAALAASYGVNHRMIYSCETVGRAAASIDALPNSRFVFGYEEDGSFYTSVSYERDGLAALLLLADISAAAEVAPQPPVNHTRETRGYERLAYSRYVELYRQIGLWTTSFLAVDVSSVTPSPALMFNALRAVAVPAKLCEFDVALMRDLKPASTRQEYDWVGLPSSGDILVFYFRTAELAEASEEEIVRKAPRVMAASDGFDELDLKVWSDNTAPFGAADDEYEARGVLKAQAAEMVAAVIDCIAYGATNEEEGVVNRERMEQEEKEYQKEKEERMAAMPVDEDEDEDEEDEDDDDDAVMEDHDAGVEESQA